MQKDRLASLDRRLLAYAIAGSTVVGGGSLAQAGIIRSGELNLSLATGEPYGPDLDGDSNPDMALAFIPWESASKVGLSIVLRPLDTDVLPGGTNYSGIVVNGTATSPSGPKDAAANLSGGFLIADTLAANSWSTSAIGDTSTAKIQNWDSTTGQALDGNFAGATEKYVGFRLHLSSNEDLVYGWVKVSILGDLNDYPANGDIILHEWAYESTPNTPIKAGAVPEPTSLAIFAMGGVGVAAWKRRRKVA